MLSLPQMGMGRGGRRGGGGGGGVKQYAYQYVFNVKEVFLQNMKQRDRKWSDC